MVNELGQRIHVDAVSKFGVLDKLTGKWINTKDKALLKSLKVGQQYDVELKQDGKYVNMVKAKLVDATVASGLASAPIVVKPSVGSKPKESKEVDWAAKDRAQMVGGRSHDAAVLTQVALDNALSVNTVLATYKELLAGIVKVADEIK